MRPEQVWDEIRYRERVLGIAEKLAKNFYDSQGRYKLAAKVVELPQHRVSKPCRA